MPLLSIETSLKEVSDKENLLKSISKEVATLLSKPESYVMTTLKSGILMTFAGTLEPSCYIQIKNIGTLGRDETKKISGRICALIEESMKIPSSRIYIRMEDVSPHMWGWDGSTFG